jgi:RNA polymerase sigma-70 factor (ECF subfamily)
MLLSTDEVSTTDTDAGARRFNVNRMRIPNVSELMTRGKRWELHDSEEQLVLALHAEHGGALLRYVTRITGDPQRAEDVVQETLLRAWRKAGALEGDSSSLRSWLFAVAHNLAIDERRARAARPEAADPELTEAAVVGQLDRALEAAQITEALRSLSRDHREALVETYFRGRSVAEAAAVLGVPPGTVKSRTYYGLRALRTALEERGWGG